MKDQVGVDDQKHVQGDGVQRPPYRCRGRSCGSPAGWLRRPRHRRVRGLGSDRSSQSLHLLDQPRRRHHRHSSGRRRLSRLDAGARQEGHSQCARESRRAGDHDQRSGAGRSEPCRHHACTLSREFDSGPRRAVRRRHELRPHQDQGRRRQYCRLLRRPSSPRTAASISCCRSRVRPTRAMLRGSWRITPSIRSASSPML